MAIIIGNNTTVTFGSNTCVISANWGYNPNAQRLYCLGEWTPWKTYYRPTETLSLTLYAPGPDYDTDPTLECADANTIAASVNPQGCGDDVGTFTGDWFVTSYSYNKDDGSLPGQESWSLQKWVDDGNPDTVLPDYIIRNISEGQSTGPETGIQLTGDTATSRTGSVSANSIGRAYVLTVGVVSKVGGGSGAAGVTGQGSASIPYTPLYL